MSKKYRFVLRWHGNGFDNPETDSNVVKLYSTLVIGPEQIAYYHPGVARWARPNSRGWVEKQWTRAWVWVWVTDCSTMSRMPTVI